MGVDLPFELNVVLQHQLLRLNFNTVQYIEAAEQCESPV